MDRINSPDLGSGPIIGPNKFRAKSLGPKKSWTENPDHKPIWTDGSTICAHRVGITAWTLKDKNAFWYFFKNFRREKNSSEGENFRNCEENHFLQYVL